MVRAAILIALLAVTLLVAASLHSGLGFSGAAAGVSNLLLNGRSSGQALSRRLSIASIVGAAATPFQASADAFAAFAGSEGSATATETHPPSGVIDYVHLWVDKDGQTHTEDCKVKELVKKKLPGGESVQYVRNLMDTVSGLNSSNVIITQQLGPNPWHHCPQTQFVVTLSGTWFINTTDGNQRYLPTGTWLFQDNSAKHPAAEAGTRKAMHYSEAVGPCNQLVLQWDKQPVIDHVCPF
eukprot:TRINITY_DN79963_c0_g1_i1.p1 TRINITY_DN79963_c0_g1~~TRINITY_DN79963_c0_g1_i1.p1  ORF type:complete len:239 (+),score=41.80 TRINITY_DN79963_c0_g1_i1:64-780(+)